MEEGHKFYCSKCRRPLDGSEFYFRKGNVRNSYCKECRKEYNKSYQFEKSEKKSEYEVITRVEDPARRSHSGIDEKYNLLTEETAPVDNANPVENVAETGINVTETAEKCTSTVPGYTKHSIAKHSIAKHTSSTVSSKPVKEWTKEDIDRLEPPADGQKRNFEGLKENLRLFHIPIPEQYAIICKTGYGLIGHPVWKGFVELRNKFGKFHSPGRFLLKQCT